jgi:hypothetical protein
LVPHSPLPKYLDGYFKINKRVRKKEDSNSGKNLTFIKHNSTATGTDCHSLVGHGSGHQFVVGLEDLSCREMF